MYLMQLCVNKTCIKPRIHLGRTSLAKLNIDEDMAFDAKCFLILITGKKLVYYCLMKILVDIFRILLSLHNINPENELQMHICSYPTDQF